MPQAGAAASVEPLADHHVAGDDDWRRRSSAPPPTCRPSRRRAATADKRSDIWAFGACCTRCSPAARAFEGEDVSDTLANVLKADPDWSRMPEDTPSQIRTLLRRSLEKDRKRRLSDIADARLEIEDASGMPTLKAHLSAPARFHMPFWWKVLPIGTMMVGLAAGYSAWMLRPISPPSVTRFVDVAAEGIVLPNPNFSAIALAPDGESAAFLADTRVFLRKFDRLVPDRFLKRVTGCCRGVCSFPPMVSGLASG